MHFKVAGLCWKKHTARRWRRFHSQILQSKHLIDKLAKMIKSQVLKILQALLFVQFNVMKYLI